MSTQIKFRRDTATNWSSVNPVLGSGEPGLETDTGKVKIGDGTTAWSGLTYIFNGYGAAYANINVAQYLPTYTGNLKASNVNATTAIYSPAYFYSNGVAFIGGGGTTYSNSNVAAYLPTYTGNVNATNLVGSTAVYAPAYYWANGAVFASSNYGNTQVAAYLPLYNGVVQGNSHVGVAVYAGTIGNTGTTLTGTLSTAAQTSITSVGNLSSLIVTGNVGIDGGQLTTYDSIIDLHTYSNLASWAADDGKDIGLRLHYFDSVDKLAFIGMENSSKSFQFLMNATETTGNVTGTFGNVQVGSLLISNSTASTSTTTGALQLTGGAGIGGSLNVGGSIQGNAYTGVAVYAGTIGNTGTTLTGTLSTGAQTNVTSLGTLTGLTSSGVVNITNGTSSTSSSTGALKVSGGVGVGGNVYVAGNIYASYINYTATTTLSTSSPIVYLTTSSVTPYNYSIGFYSNIYTASSYTGLVRNHNDNVWTLFSNVGAPTGSAFNLADSNLVYDTLKTGRLVLANTTVATSPSTGALVVSGGAGIAGDVYANSYTGVAVYAGTIGNTNTTLVGTLSTATQNNITSVGTLSSLAVTGAVQGNTHVGYAVYANTIGNTGATLVGAVGTNVQPYITSLGTLTSLNVGGSATASTVSAGTIGNSGASLQGATATLTGAVQANSYTGVAVYAGTIGNTGATLAGTLSSATQSSITAVGTLSSLIVAGATQSSSFTGINVYANTIGNSGATIVGLVGTNAQPYITSLGNLTALNVATGVYSPAYYYSNGTAFTGGYNDINVTQLLQNYTGNLSAGNLTIIGNITSVNYETVTQTEYANIINASGNITTLGTLTAVNVATGNIAAIGDAVVNGNVTTNGNIIAQNITATLYGNSLGTDANYTGNVNANNVTTSTAVYANAFYWYNNGAAFSSSTYSNLDVGNYLPTYSGNIAASNLTVDTYGIYAANYYWANGSTYNGVSTYSNTDVAGYLPTYNGNIRVGNISINNNLAIATTRLNASAYGEIQSNRMMGRYNTVTGNYFDVNSTVGIVDGGDASVAGRIPSYMSPVAGLETLQPAYGTNFGNKKVGLGFHIGTYNDISTATVSGSPLYADNINAVVLGYMNNGPRISLMDYALDNDIANVMAFTSSVYKMYSPNGTSLLTLDSSSKNLTLAGNIFANSGLMSSNLFVSSAVYAGTIGNTDTVLTGTLNTASQPNITGIGTLSALTVNGTVNATTHVGAFNGAFNGTVGANTPNTGAFTNVTLSGNLTVNGNIIQNGNVTILNANNITINDTLIYLANSNPANSYEMGMVGQFTAGTTQYTGIVRDHTNNNWTFFSNIASNPTGNVLTFNSTTVYDTIRVGGIVWGNGVSYASTITVPTANTAGAATYVTSLTAANVQGVIGSVTTTSFPTLNQSTTGAAARATYVTGLTAANVQAVIGSVTTTSFPTLNQNTTGSAQYVTGLTASNVQGVIGSVTTTSFPTLNQNTTGSAQYVTGLTAANVTSALSSTAVQNATAAQYVTGLTAANVQGVIGSVTTTSFPTLNQNTTGNSAGLTGTPNISVNNITVGTIGIWSANATITGVTVSGVSNGATGPLNGTIGATSPNTAAFTTVTTTGNITTSGTVARLGINTSTPKGAIQANGVAPSAYFTNTGTSNIDRSWIYFEKTDTTSRSNDQMGGITWQRTLTDGISIAESYITVTGSTTVANGRQNITVSANNDVIFQTAAYDGGTYKEVLRIKGTTGQISTMGSTPRAGANLNVQGNIYAEPGGVTGAGYILAGSYISMLGVDSNGAAISNQNVSGIGNIGSSGATFNTLFAKATSALYADLAECYAADANYTPGTVVDFGGDAEVTLSSTDESRRVAGVISTNPAHLMNSQIEAEFVAAVALTGRVPTLVQGTVMKGDTMVSAGNGRARAESNPKISTVIGKALENFDGDEGTIEIVVGRL